MTTVKNSALSPSKARSEIRDKVPVLHVTAGAELCAQSGAQQRLNESFPTWFASPSVACAYAIRTPGDTQVHVASSTSRVLVLVDLIQPDAVRAVIAVLEKKLNAIVIPGDGEDDGRNDEQRRLDRGMKRALSYEQKRLNKLVTAVKFATGMGASLTQQESILRYVHHDDAVTLRDGFGTKDGDVSPSVTMGGVSFGHGEHEFNRISVGKYDYLMALAVQEALPWADGYAASACPSTWHRDQLYPSEVCLFKPGHCLSEGARQLDEFPEVKKHLTGKKVKTEPLETPSPYSYGTRIYLEGRKEETSSGVSETVGGAPDTVVSASMETLAPVMSLDNPLCNNDVSTLDANFEAWSICPPPSKKRHHARNK